MFGAWGEATAQIPQATGTISTDFGSNSKAPESCQEKTALNENIKLIRIWITYSCQVLKGAASKPHLPFQGAAQGHCLSSTTVRKDSRPISPPAHEPILNFHLLGTGGRAASCGFHLKWRANPGDNYIAAGERHRCGAAPLFLHRCACKFPFLLWVSYGARKEKEPRHKEPEDWLWTCPSPSSSLRT